MAADLEKILPVDKATIYDAFIRAYTQFDGIRRKWKAEAKHFLSKDGKGDQKIKILLLGRPYAVFDQTLNNGILKKIESMGYDVLHQSMLEDGSYLGRRNPRIRSRRSF